MGVALSICLIAAVRSAKETAPDRRKPELEIVSLCIFYPARARLIPVFLVIFSKGSRRQECRVRTWCEKKEHTRVLRCALQKGWTSEKTNNRPRDTHANFSNSGAADAARGPGGRRVCAATPHKCPLRYWSCLGARTYVIFRINSQETCKHDTCTGWDMAAPPARSRSRRGGCSSVDRGRRRPRADVIRALATCTPAMCRKKYSPHPRSGCSRFGPLKFKRPFWRNFAVFPLYIIHFTVPVNLHVVSFSASFNFISKCLVF
jgi:hypothetical protein